jgi:hypothetical protein
MPALLTLRTERVKITVQRYGGYTYERPARPRSKIEFILNREPFEGGLVLLVRQEANRG